MSLHTLYPSHLNYRLKSKLSTSNSFIQKTIGQISISIPIGKHCLKNNIQKHSFLTYQTKQKEQTDLKPFTTESESNKYLNFHLKSNTSSCLIKPNTYTLHKEIVNEPKKILNKKIKRQIFFISPEKLEGKRSHQSRKPVRRHTALRTRRRSLPFRVLPAPSSTEQASIGD